MNAPFIKWSGSKRYQAKDIVGYFPRKIGTYYECFLGGGSVFRELLEQIWNNKISCEEIICSDVNKDLIDIFNILLSKPDELFDYYSNCYEKIKERSKIAENSEFTRENVANAQSYYYEMRDKYNNASKDDPERPYIFYWLTRTCFNGLIRYNPKGKFNASFHVAGRLGITPQKLKTVFDEWVSRMSVLKDKIYFVNDSFTNVVSNAKCGDLVYMDPPYENTKACIFAKNSTQKCYMTQLEV